jgi:hypothetical protein
MLHRHGGTLCHRFASLLEDGDPLLQVPHVRFERTVRAITSASMTAGEPASRVTEGASGRLSSPEAGTLCVCGTAALFGADTSRRGA